MEGPFFEETILVTPSRLPDRVQDDIVSFVWRCAARPPGSLRVSTRVRPAENRIDWNEEGVPLTASCYLTWLPMRTTVGYFSGLVALILDNPILLQVVAVGLSWPGPNRPATGPARSECFLPPMGWIRSISTCKT